MCRKFPSNVISGLATGSDGPPTRAQSDVATQTDGRETRVSRRLIG